MRSLQKFVDKQTTSDQKSIFTGGMNAKSVIIEAPSPRYNENYDDSLPLKPEFTVQENFVDANMDINNE